MINSTLEEFVLEGFRRGINVKCADIIVGKYFLYLLSNRNILYPCVLYKSRISLREHKGGFKPRIHFCNCKMLDEALCSPYTKAKLALENAFDYEVGFNGKYASNIFYDVELPFCELCVESYNKIFGDFSGELKLWEKLISHKSFVYNEQVALDKSINTNLSHLELHKDDRHFFLSYK